MRKMDKEYTLLFNGITDALVQLDELKAKLEALQLQAEKIVIEKDENAEESLLYVAKDTLEVS